VRGRPVRNEIRISLSRSSATLENYNVATSLGPQRIVASLTTIFSPGFGRSRCRFRWPSIQKIGPGLTRRYRQPTAGDRHPDALGAQICASEYHVYHAQPADRVAF